MSLKVGDAAPDFTLKNHHLEDVKLSDFKGEKNVVILFFPLLILCFFLIKLGFIIGT